MFKARRLQSKSLVIVLPGHILTPAQGCRLNLGPSERCEVKRDDEGELYIETQTQGVMYLDEIAASGKNGVLPGLRMTNRNRSLGE